MSSCDSLNISTKLEVVLDKSEDLGAITLESEDGKIPPSKNHTAYVNNNSRSRSSGEARHEFRMARGGVVSDRGRAAGSGGRGRAFKKSTNDREQPNSDTSYSRSTSRPKLQESLKNQENKFYDEKKNEDSRLSKLIRRLSREDDYERFMGLCKQIQEGIVAPDNQKYIKRNVEMLCDNLLDAFHTSPSQEAKQQVAKCLGRIGYTIDGDFKRFMEHLCSKYSSERKDDTKCWLLKALNETLKLDAEKLKLRDYSLTIMSQLQSILENVDRPELLYATCDALLMLVDSYPDSLNDYFRDTVDILVGWHIDTTQPKPVVGYASRSLQKLRKFWISDLEFTLTLLGQFLEDMESYDEELTGADASGRTSPDNDTSATAITDTQDCILRITSLIGVFNTVVKCTLDHLSPAVTPLVQWNFLTDCLYKMLRTAIHAIELDDVVEITTNDIDISPENIDRISKYMRNLNMSQKTIDLLIRNLGQSDLSDESLVKAIKSLNIKQKNFKNSSMLNKEKEESLLNLLKSLDLKVKRQSDLSEEKEELIIVANECTGLLLSYIQSRVTKSLDLLYKFVDHQLARVGIFWDDTIVSMLNTISKVIREVSANLPLNLIHTLLGQESPMMRLRFRNSMSIQNAVLEVYYSLLSLKNIPLLQEAYRYILSDMEIAYEAVLPNPIEPLVSENPLKPLDYSKPYAEVVLIFLLRALSDLASASNSIIGMWALKPSILDLLAVKLRPYDAQLSVESCLLQYHILFLLYTHCSKHNHFVTSSSLVTQGPTIVCRTLSEVMPITASSPTSGNLSIVIGVISKTVENKKAPAQTVKLMLSWIREINLQAESCFALLCDTTEYQTLIFSLLVCGASTDPEIANLVCTNLEDLMRTNQIVWPDKIYIDVMKLVILHLTSYDRTVRQNYSRIYQYVPLNIAMARFSKAGLLLETKKIRSLRNYSSESIVLAQRLYMRNNSSEMLPQLFKTYMAYILQERYFDPEGVMEMFTHCWPTICDNELVARMYEFALSNQAFLFFWGGFEAAQHCVLNKLRTSLGKPQETFTTIEGALKGLAREITCGQTSNSSSFGDVSSKSKQIVGTDALMREHTRVRLLVEFLEHLERVIHNAADGCAVALLPFSKPVRTFFHMNRSTCREWLNRIRLALCVVSLHAGLATSALRNGQRLLEDLCTANNTQGSEFERATLCTARAMVMLREAEALQGLYVYAKDKDRKFVWLKAAMEEASGRYEMAAESYHQLLDDYVCTSQETPLDKESQVVPFCMERLTKCYKSLGDWKQLTSWSIRESEILEDERYAHFNKDILDRVMPEQASSYASFENDEYLSLQALSNWNLLPENSAKRSANWSYVRTVSECSNTLTNLALRYYLKIGNESLFLDDTRRCKDVAAKIVEEGLRNAASEHMDEAALLYYCAHEFETFVADPQNSYDVFRIRKFDDLDSELNASTLTQVLWWSDYFAKVGGSELNEIDKLRLSVVRLARKAGNNELAKREIGKFFSSSHDWDTIVQEILYCGTEDIVWSIDNVTAFREISKLLYSANRNEDALRMCSVTALGISKSIIEKGEASAPELREIGTKSLLTLGKWIQRDAKIDNNSHLEQLLQFEFEHNDGLMDKLFGKTTELIPPSDVIVGKLMQLGVNQCPDLPNAWSNFAAWCYKWGRKIVDGSSSQGLLTEVDRQEVKAIQGEEDLEAILKILDQSNVQVVAPEDEGDIDGNFGGEDSNQVEGRLRNVVSLTGASDDKLKSLVNVRKQAQGRIYSYYELSVNAYFKYLQLARGDNDCETITATLRLLRLVVKHASELQTALESGLSTTPTGPWKEIIPQLFSRLSHPEAYVRNRVSELLGRIADSSPHLITFPAVVGVTSNDDRSQIEWSGEESDEEVDKNQGFTEACFVQLTEGLCNKIPDTVEQIKVLVKELRRITLLWDELWLATLCQHHSDFTKRFEMLELEIQKVQGNIWLASEEKNRLIVEKYHIILKPIVFILENLMSITSAPPETPHERNFQEKYGTFLAKVVDKLKNPKNPAKPGFASSTLKQLESKLAQRINKRGAYALQMSDISPVLAKLKDTSIAMPGVAASKDKMITIKQVENAVHVLPTKTKPKKLVFRGSDGHQHTYLFKGLEDLHLDERIMQFLGICNTMMSKNDNSKKLYRARHYSVIPLGPRSGLIQWVDGVTPLFALYKRWQQRENAMANNSSAKGGASSTNNNQSVLLRPSELFYSKLTPLLNERNIAVENRKDWPLPVLKQVLSELMAETPHDLLAKEIWCNSLNAGSWWQATKNYSYSVAVMSVIGYIIGLGDRHLDNVLVDLNTGEVVHIDYNVCFEKGKTLRVPEKVPFRMTPNIKTALGVTGVEGIFRLACEHTLRVMRRGRETLLTLLEAFVYEPLVDWRAGGDNGIANYGVFQSRARNQGSGRRNLEAELTAAMFTVRVAEMRSEWLANREELTKIFPGLIGSLTQWIDYRKAGDRCRDSLEDRHRQLALVKEAQAMGRGHSLYSLKKRFSSLKSCKQVLEKIRSDMKEKIDECKKQVNSHKLALGFLRGAQLSRWMSELEESQDHMVFELVKEFLQNAGQSQTIAQCEQSETELTQLAAQQSILLRGCLDLLSQYSAICGLYPASHLAQHRSALYGQWADRLQLQLNNSEARLQVFAELKRQIEPIVVGDAQCQQALGFSFQIQTILAQANEKFTKIYEKVLADGLPEGMVQIEAAYAQAKYQVAQFEERPALDCAILTQLCTLNKKYLMMEGAAKCAGDCLVNLTSRDGDWFLDELRLMSQLVTEILDLVPDESKSDEKTAPVLKCLRDANVIHRGLQELNYNFQTIILPEALKSIVVEESSALKICEQLDGVVSATGFTLIQIIDQLELHLRFTVMQMDSPHESINEAVTKLRNDFEALFFDCQEAVNGHQDVKSPPNPGQMLLMGFNGLFEKLQMDGDALMNDLRDLDVPKNWRKIDQVREARESSAQIFREDARVVLRDIFFVKRIHTIQKFFSMCRVLGASFRNGQQLRASDVVVYSDEHLNEPVRSFSADYVVRQLLGLGSQSLATMLCLLMERTMGFDVSEEVEQRDVGADGRVSLEELCKKVVDTAVRKGDVTASGLAQAGTLCVNLENAWKRSQGAQLTQQSWESLKSTVQRLQLYLTAHNWLHEDHLMIGGGLNIVNPINRPAFMLELRKNATALTALQSRVTEAQEHQQNLVATAIQRLKWAAGANPAVAEVMSAFDIAVAASSKRLSRQSELSTAVAATCSSIFHFEALRTNTQESKTNDTNFLTLFKYWEESCVLYESLSVGLTPLEENLAELLPAQLEATAEKTSDEDWLAGTEVVVSEAIAEEQKNLQDSQEASKQIRMALQDEVALLQAVVAEHHKLMNDVRALLRSMIKQENIPGLQEFLMDYRSWTESLSQTVKELESEDLNENRASTLREKLDTLASKTPTIYGKLLSFAQQLPNEQKGLDIRNKQKLVKQESACLSPKKAVVPSRDPTTGKAMQERNAYALNVWRRVRMKLEGRDPNPGRKYTTAEQVEFVIREATSVENLALLYEGWTPWV